MFLYDPYLVSMGFLLRFFVCLFVLMRTIFKVFIEFVTILLLLNVLVFWLFGMREFSFLTRDCLTLEGAVLTTGQRGKSLRGFISMGRGVKFHPRGGKQGQYDRKTVYSLGPSPHTASP